MHEAMSGTATQARATAREAEQQGESSTADRTLRRAGWGQGPWARPQCWRSFKLPFEHRSSVAHDKLYAITKENTVN